MSEALWFTIISTYIVPLLVCIIEVPMWSRKNISNFFFFFQGSHSDEPITKKSKSQSDSSKISKHSLSPSAEDDDDESSHASSDEGSPGLEIDDTYNKCFVCK